MNDPLEKPKKLFGTIYKLCYDDKSDIFYIGSTTRKLNTRLREHKYDLKVLRGSKKKIDYFKDYINDLKIVIIEEFYGYTKKDFR